MPVVDADQRMVGIVTVDDVIDIICDEATSIDILSISFYFYLARWLFRL